MAKASDVKSAENRGSKEVPFGFVYFADGNRLGYQGRDAGLYVFESNWGPVPSSHYYTKAKAYLKDMFAPK